MSIYIYILYIYIYIVCNLFLQEFHKFFEFMNSINRPDKNKFTMSIANNDSSLEFLD